MAEQRVAFYLLLIATALSSFNVPTNALLRQPRRAFTSRLVVATQMAWFEGPNPSSKKLAKVYIESPTINSRKITSSITIDGTPEDVYSILTDYNNLADSIPNLTKSYLVPSPVGVKRIFQEGAQRIIGFEFRASLIMDMVEYGAHFTVPQTPSYFSSSSAYSTTPVVMRQQQWALDGVRRGNGLMAERRLGFKLVESTMFSAFEGKKLCYCIF
jgi:hypothetical protein